MDPEIAELFSRSRSQEEEILLLRKQIADACAKELQLLNEKHVLERKLSDLQMTLNGKHNDAITDTLKELNHRKGYLEENLRLADELKVMEDERYIFTSSLLSLLAEYGIRPPLIDASIISNGTKHLYHQLHWKLRSSHASIVDMNHQLGNQPGDVLSNISRPASTVLKSQLSEVPNVYGHQYNQHGHDLHPESTSDQSRFVQDHEMMDMKELKFADIAEMRYPFISNKQRGMPSTILKDVEGPTTPTFHHFGDGAGEAKGRKAAATASQFPVPANPYMYDSEGEVLPGIEAFQIIGDAKPGCTLRACGFPTHGNSLCMFQWVRHLQDGTRHYIEGATNPDYVVTADDVDKLIAVECIPMDDSGRQGELVRHFANNQDKITCDPDMQHEIGTYVSAGRAIFSVLLLMDSSEVWEQTTLILKRSLYQIKLNHTDVLLFNENYSADLSIKVPYGLSTQFVLTSSDGTSYPFSTNGTSHPLSTDNALRLRDLIVLTIRIFQAKALDDKKKGKA